LWTGSFENREANLDAPVDVELPMAFERLPFDAETHLADVHMFQQEGFGAVYLVDDERKAIIETGTSWDVERILEAVRTFGLRPGDIDALIVSHIHLDHAGGAGFLLESMPRAKVYVHERGFKHLVDPTRLVASAREALGPEEAEIFGTMRPIPAERVVAVKDRDRLDLGKHSLVFIDSPGHAPHEVTILDERNRCLYAGDAAGLYFPGDEILMPIAPAPAFDLEKSIETFRAILALQPRALLFSHYGPHRNPRLAIEAMMTAYPAWARLVKGKLDSIGEDGVLRELYDMSCRAAKRYPRDFLERRIRVSITGLAAYHERMEHATRNR
jgi:glyoxylase-like metal-dependent hydrolase (beta-lactamase superfamily II)